MPGQAYLLTLMVDEAFLTDENTVYPVIIDPTMEVRASNSSSNIIDAPIFNGYPNTNYGNFIFNRVGKVSAYGVGRTVVKLPTLTESDTYTSLSADNITSVKFYVKEASGTAAISVSVYPLVGNSVWTESNVTWNNAGSADGAAIDTQSLSYTNWKSFDITSLVKKWKTGAYNANCGFIMIGSSTTNKSFFASEHSTADSRPYVVMTYTGDVTLSKTVADVDEGKTLTLTATTTPTGQTVTWSSADTSIATVSNGGTVTGVAVGSTTITAKQADGSSASCLVYVTVADGVYYIKSSVGLYLASNGSIAENAPVSLQAQATSDTLKPLQLWKITYLGNGYYVVRPMHKLDMALNSTSNNVDIVAAAGANTLDGVPPAKRWSITPGLDGYYNLNYVGTSSMSLTYPTGAIYSGMSAITAVNSGTSSSFNWSLEMAPGVFLYDSTYSLPDSSSPIEIEMGETQTLSELGIIIELNQIDGYTWSSNNPTYVAVDEDTGGITAHKRGDATLTITAWSGAAEYTAQVYIASIETIYVKNYYDSTIAGNTEIIQNISAAVDFLNRVYQDEFNLRFMMDDLPEQYGNAAVDICDNRNQHYCTYSNETNCSALCTSHHKNVHRISSELYPSVNNTVAVMWSNCKEGIFCESINGVHTTKETDLALVTFEEVDGERIHAPVVQFLTINQNQLLTGFEQNQIFMSITLAHEIAHTLGMSDVYNNSYYPNVTVHTNYATVPCIMAYFDQANAENFYQSIQNGTSAFCADCIELLHSEMVENVYEN